MEIDQDLYLSDFLARKCRDNEMSRNRNIVPFDVTFEGCAVVALDMDMSEYRNLEERKEKWPFHIPPRFCGIDFEIKTNGVKARIVGNRANVRESDEYTEYLRLKEKYDAKEKL